MSVCSSSGGVARDAAAETAAEFAFEWVNDVLDTVFLRDIVLSRFAEGERQTYRRPISLVM